MAQRSRQQIRKIRTAGIADFDDQLWPVNVTILILAGLSAGIVYATSEFDDPRVFQNGYTRLGCVALVSGVFVWAMTRLTSLLSICYSTSSP